MGYSPSKMVSLGQKWKMPKRCEKRSYDHIRVGVSKKRFKKHLILEKWEDFKNSQNWPPCMGYSPCKLVSLVQKLKMLKSCEKRCYDHIKVNMSKTVLQKTPNTGKWDDFKNGQNWPPCMSYSPCKMVSLGQKWKRTKMCEKQSFDHIRVIVSKKAL